VRLRVLVRHAPVAVDQAVSSASNFLLALLVAQTATAADFGEFAIATSVYWLFLGAVRALIAEPLLILQARDGRSRAAMSAAVGLAVGLSMCAALAGAALGLFLGFGAVPVLLIGLPVLVWQDMLRYCAFSLGRPVEALLSDAVWLALLVATGGPLLSAGGAPTAAWLLVWTGCAAAALVVPSVRIGIRPALAGRRAWWSASRRQALPMLGDFAVLSVETNLFVFLLPLVTSLALLGQYKAAYVVNGPLSILMTAAALVALPLLARRRAEDGAAPLGVGLAIGTGMAVVAAGYGVALLLVPAGWGELLFGDSWVGVGILPALIAFNFAVLCLNQGALLTLRAIGEVRPVLVARTVLLPVSVLLPLVAAGQGGAPALGAALIVLAGLYGAVWWLLALRAARRLRRTGPAEPAEPSEAVPA
jgi:O-antigen/teichoic acid export membrane protein